MFGLFRRKSKPRHAVWKTEAAKERGIVRGVREAAASGRAALVVGHFRDTVARFAVLFDEAGLAFEQVARGVEATLRKRSNGGVLLVHVDAIEQRFDDTAVLVDDPCAIIVADVHPSQEQLDRITAFHAALPKGTTAWHHVSLEDPLMAQFAGPKTIQVLEQLGLEDEDMIEHRMLDGSIARALAKLRALGGPEAGADNAESWLQMRRR